MQAVGLHCRLLATQCRVIRGNSVQVETAYKFKLAPTSEQQELLLRMAGCGRVVYNDSLALTLNIIKNHTNISDTKALYTHLNSLSFSDRKTIKKLVPSSAAFNKLLTAWKKTKDRAWLTDAFAGCLQQRQRDFIKSIEGWVKGVRGFPVFRSRKLAHHSTMRFPDPKKQIKVLNKHIHLPNGLGLVRYRNSRPVIGEWRNATVSLNAVGEWHISIMCLRDIELPEKVTGAMAGIDMGIAKNITCSTNICGDKGVFAGVHSFRKYQDKLVIEQKRLSRKVLGSVNWKKQKLKIAKLHQRITNIRRNYQHQATTQICNNHAMVIVEALNVKNMSKSAKGDNETHGKNVAAKAVLNKSILDQGWGNIRLMLQYKMHRKGGIYGEENPRNSSRECACCGYIHKDNRISQSAFHCLQCGRQDNADKNAAKVILKRYLASLKTSEAA